MRSLFALAIIVFVGVHANDVFTATTGVGSAMDVQERRGSSTEFYVPSRTHQIYKLQRTGSGNNAGSFTLTNFLSQTYPTSVGSDNSGNLYFSEQDVHTVKKVVISSVTVTTLATGFSNPYSAAWNPNNNLLYVNSFSENKVYTVHSSSGVKTLFAGTGADAGADGPRLSSPISCPLYGDFDPSYTAWYVNCYCRGTIRKVDFSSGNIITVAGLHSVSGSNDGPGVSARFSTNMRGVSVAADGSVYVGDMQNNLIRRISGGYVTTVAGNGGSGNVDGPALSIPLNQMWGLTAHVPGYVYYADYPNGRVRGLTLQTYCCQELYSECAALHATCNGMDLTPLQQACQADSELCSAYNAAVLVKNSCNRMASDCDALIGGC